MTHTPYVQELMTDITPAPPEEALVAIGDIHGCNTLLQKLLAKIERKMGTKPYRLVFLGDYVDRGPDSRGVIETLTALALERPGTVFLRGNHEQAMLDFLAVGEGAEGWVEWGGEQTLDSYGVKLDFPYDLDKTQRELAAALPDTHFDFLMSLPTRFDAGPYVFVHAGVDPSRGLDEQIERDLLWIRDPFFAEGEGKFPDHIIVHGHTPVKKVDNLAWRINVDTGAVWTSKLTAVVLTDGKRQFITT
ncbi:metallophosphoesterase family protein [Parvularcula sp. LCG005]|uniref:metallophosphoesterase family protein n=1 Tax=Parvularcula sp. LCG005 TaxID=3078805 RepID=UPI00294262E0|nr:metallophosphoesterase family protein [Parvularcula sp. LCG005]WOI52722.1 metallophosphoesterase family protein [Parvularcula sp. LCG005]